MILGFQSKINDKAATVLATLCCNNQKLRALLQNKRISWETTLQCAWFTNNAKLEPAKNNNYTYGKIEPKSRKTDGFMAFVAGMCIEI